MRPSEISLEVATRRCLPERPRWEDRQPQREWEALKLTLRSCTTPFEGSSYDRVSDRKSLDLRADDETAAFPTRLDTELKKYAGKVGCAESGYTLSLIHI